ncbi:MAG: RecQ family ATP-dependent DNA helicase [Myxococcota bacterium]
MPPLDAILRDRLGYPGFRPGQAEIVEHVVGAGDALVVMPTGAGKSLCYQLPAVAMGGVTLVVSPLIALMKDQVDGLTRRGVRATLINSTLSPPERHGRVREVQQGEWEIVFVAPERFTPRFVEEMRGADVRLFAIDEAHCLSQWGHDFRPDYLRLGKVREALGSPRTLALTATATPEVQDDILRTLGLPEARRFIRGFDRENLGMECIAVGGPREKDQLLPELVRPGPALVYCATRKNVERAAAALAAAGVTCAAYHGGLELPDRARVQDDFMGGRLRVVVATNAFGMGVDKEDVRTIVHYDLPGTVEAYYQEIGRAGRDGKKSRVVLLFREEDRRTQEFFIDMAHPPAAWVHAVWEGLKKRGTNPVFVSMEDLAEEIHDDAAGDRAASSCIYLLQREGRVRRIAPAERAGVVRFTGTCAETHGLRRKVYDALRAQGEVTGLWPDRLAEELDLTRDQVTAALRGLEDRGVLVYTAPERTGGVELIDPDLPLRIDEARIRARRARELAKLQKMVDYGHAGCRRRYVLEYFGDKPPWDRCGDCDACREGKSLGTGPRALLADETVVVRKVLSCVARMGKPFSPGMIAKVVTGSRDGAVLAFKFDRLSTFGLLSTFTQREVEQVIAELVRAGALSREFVSREVAGRDRSYGEVWLTDLGKAVMAGRADDFRMCFPLGERVVRTRPAAGASRVASADLLAHLRDVRTRLAKAHDKPAYVICPNRTLEDMAAKRPMTRQAMLDVHGMGPERFRLYGGELLDAVRSWTGG